MIDSKKFYNTNSLIFFSIISIISIISSYFGTTIIQDLSTNPTFQIFYNFIIFSLYFLAISIYYFNFSLRNIIYLSIAFSIIFAFFSFIILYYGYETCKEIKSQTAGYIIHFAIIVLSFIISYLGLINKNNLTSWNYRDSGIFVILLILIRIGFYVINKFNMTVWDVILKIISFIVILINLRRIYYSLF